MTGKVGMRIACCLALVCFVSCVRGWSQNAAGCTLAGVWYGGSDAAKYMLSLTPEIAGKYAMTGAPAFTQESLGYPVTTPFFSEVVRNPKGIWEFFSTGMVNKSGGFPAPAPELWAVHGRARLLDCETLKLDYDFFGAYFTPTDKKPFLSAPDYVVVPPPFSETYKRMPTVCTKCGS